MRKDKEYSVLMGNRGKSGVLPAALLGVLHHLLVVVSCLLYLLPLGRLLLCHGLLLARYALLVYLLYAFLHPALHVVVARALFGHGLVHPVSRTVRRSLCRLPYLV